MKEYEAIITIRVQGASLDDVPGLLLEAMSEHDHWPVQVVDLEDETAPVDEIWMDKNTGLRVHPDWNQEHPVAE